MIHDVICYFECKRRSEFENKSYSNNLLLPIYLHMYRL